ncbi:MAG: 4Fe-4S dicluster domain-containing protein [Acidimicrobiales bacterium]
MPQTSSARAPIVIAPSGLDELLGALAAAGYEVLGPTVRDGAVVIEPITSSSQLPRGWGDAQEPGSYRLSERGDDAFFGFAAPAGTWKRYLFPPRSVLWRSRREGDRVIFEQDDPAQPPRAFLGIRACDLAAIAVQDRVFVDGRYADPVYGGRRHGLFLIGVNCGDPAATCFCTSMGTGPDVAGGADLVLTELDPADPARHRFVVQALTDRGHEVSAGLTSREAAEADLTAAAGVTQLAVARMQRSMNTERLPEILQAAPNHPRWDEVASRCLSCGNCTMACPTCFCADVSDQPNAATGVDERVREWASCFQLSHSYLHGGSLRVSTKARYRQWMTHKLSTWWDQFGVSGCVGCGRCIAWCPVGIDITEEVRAIRGSSETVQPEEVT